MALEASNLPKPLTDTIEKCPQWARTILESCKSIKDIDKIDQEISQIPIDKLKSMLKELPSDSFTTLASDFADNPFWRYNAARLPGLLKLNGKPYSLARHRFFEPLFYPQQPAKTLLCCARQVGKSSTLAAQGVIQAAAISRFKALYLAPQFEQIRRFTHQYVKPYIHESWIKPLITDKNTQNSVLHKTLTNFSELWFSFALLSVDRVRGIAVDAIRIDEIQDLQIEFLDVIRECMSASEMRSEMYAGTAKTKDNIIEILRLQSSQAEWCMKCKACNHWNIPTMEWKVADMLGPDGLCCSKCARLINPEEGHWVHAFPERAMEFPGYHVPQVIVPVHYANKRNWQSLLEKRDTTAPATFINENLGEAWDEGTRLVSIDELKKAATLGKNSIEHALEVRTRYADIILGVDWGGKGERMQSYTACAAVGVSPNNNKLDVFFGKVYPAMMDPVDETKDIVQTFSKLGASSLAHDVAVAGEVRRSVIRQIGVPDARLINCRYSLSQGSKKMIEFKPANEINPAAYHNMDKYRVVAAVCLAIRAGQIRFPDWDEMQTKTGHNLLEHFLAVYEEMTETSHGGEKKFIKRNAGMPDDFLHAVAFAVASAWYRYPETQPSLRDSFFQNITDEDRARLEPPVYDDWV